MANNTRTNGSHDFVVFFFFSILFHRHLYGNRRMKMFSCNFSSNVNVLKINLLIVRCSMFEANVSWRQTYKWTIMRQFIGNLAMADECAFRLRRTVCVGIRCVPMINCDLELFQKKSTEFIPNGNEYLRNGFTLEYHWVLCRFNVNAN